MSTRMISYMLIIYVIFFFPAIVKAETNYDSQRDFNDRITEIFRLYRTTTPVTWHSLNDDVIFQTAIDFIDPVLHDIYIEEYNIDLTRQANFLNAISKYLWASYSDPVDMLSLYIQWSVKGMYTIEDALAGIPRPEYDLEDPPLYIQWDFNKFHEYQRFQYLLLGYLGEAGLEASIELYQLRIPAFGIRQLNTWVVLGDRAVEILERMIADGELESGIRFDAERFIEEWTAGGFRYIYNEYAD